MTHQPELGLFRYSPEHPDVAWLKAYLLAHGWQTRRSLCVALQLPATDGNLRRIRALAEAAGADVVRGQQGFAHVDRVTIQDLTDAAAQSISHGKCMLKYGIALRRKAHAKVA